MFATLYNKVSRGGSRLAAFIALIALTTSSLVALEPPAPAAAAIVTNNLVLNLDASNTSSLAATGAPGWNSVSPASSTATSTFFGNASRTSDTTGASVVMDGTGDAAVFPAGTARTAGAMTVDTWIKPGNLRAGWNVFASRWFSDTARSGSSATNDWHLAFYGTSSSNIKLQLNAGTQVLTSNTVFPTTSANQWYHIAFTIDAANTATLWINGVADGTIANFPHTDNATAQLHVGDVGDAVSNSAFNGNISRFRIYSAALTSAQLAQNYLTDSARYGYAPTNTVLPTTTGIAKVGAALSTTGGTWGVGDADGTTTAYQWQTSTDATNWTNISGATSASYTPVAGDATNFLRVSVTKTNTAGSATATSATTLRVQNASGTAIVSGGTLTGLTSTVPNDATTYNVTLASNNLSATMRLGTTTGLTLISGYATTASYMASTIGASAPIISFRGTGTAINTALANVTYTSATQQTDVVKLYYATAGTTTTDTKDYIPIYDNGVLTFHYYAYKVHASGKNRADMDAALVGLGPTDNVQAPGPWYLSTPRYQVEWERIKLIVGQNQAYMGARADAGSANWYWPANTDGYSSATIFGTQSGSTVTATSTIYNQTNTTLPYHSGEPNAGTVDGRSGFFYIVGSQLGWDDVPLTITGVASFTMETYGTAPFNTGSAGTLTQTVSVVAAHADAPTGFTAAAAGTSSIVMGWNLSSANTTGTSITGYRMEASTTSNFTTVVASSAPTTYKSFILSGLATNTLYYVRVMATTSSGNGAATSALTVTTTSAATTITVVSSGGGTEGTDYSLINGYFVSKSGLSVSINASAIQTALGSAAVNLAADNVVVNAPISWNLYPTLTLGNTTSSTVAINKSITANSASAWISITSSTYSLDVKSGASINFPAAGTSNRLYVGGTFHTVLKTEADLATVVAGGNYALGKSIALTSSYTGAPISLNFSGTFDGLGNTIDSMKISPPAGNNYGLFSNLVGGVIRNVGITNLAITLGTDSSSVGGLVGLSSGGTIDQTWTTGFIRTTTTNAALALGGIVGRANSGTTNISKSWSSVNIDSSASGTATALEQGGIIGGDESGVPQVNTAAGGNVNLSQVYATGTLKWASTSHRGIGGLMGLHYSTGTTAITDAFSWVTFASGVPAGNLGGIIGVGEGGATTLTRTYQTTSSACVSWVATGFSATPNCDTKRAPGETVSGISGSNWTSTGATVLANLAAPYRPLYVQVVAPTDGSYATVSYQIVDGSGAVQNTAALSTINLSVSGTPVYKAAGVVLNAASAKATYVTYYDSGLTLGGTAASSYSLTPWRDTTSVTISKFAQTVTWTPTTSVSFGSGTFTPIPAPVASGGTTVTFSVSSAGTTGCTVNASTGAITYTAGGSCVITATAANAGDWLIATDTETFVIAEPATAPTSLAATAAGNGVLNIGWTAPTVNSSAAITGYTLTYSTNSGMSTPTTVNVGNTTGYLLTGLTPGTVYYFQVRAVSGSTWTGPLSTIASATPNSTATTLNVVASGGGVAGTDYTINGGVISTTGTASINASVISTLLATEGTVQLAATNVNLNAAISWSSNSVLVLGNTSAATVNVNSTITGTGNTAGVNILPSSYGLQVKSGSYVRLTGTTPTFRVGGTAYTVVNTVAGLANVAAGTNWALTAPITLTSTYSTAVKDFTFTGIMDGLGNTINNMNIAYTTSNNFGFFNALNGATIRNAGFTNVNIASSTGALEQRVGSIAGNGCLGGACTVSQVWASGFISQSATTGTAEVGGFFGGATAGTLNISKSWSSVSISTSVPNVGSGGIIGTNVPTYRGVATPDSTFNALTITESYSVGNILRDLPATGVAWYGNGGIIGVAYGYSATITNSFTWGTINATGANSSPMTSTGGVVGVSHSINGTSVTTLNTVYTTSSTCIGTGTTGCTYNAVAGAAVTGFSTGLWSTTNGASLANVASPTKLLYVRVKAPTDGSFATVGTEIVDSTGTLQTLSSLNLSVSGTATFDTVTASTLKGTYNVNYVSGLTLGGSSAGVYSLNAWKTATSLTISKYSQTITWAPTLAIPFKAGTFTPSSLATSSGGTTITYSLSSAGTTGCTVNSSTGVVTYTSAGTCTVTATGDSSGDYLTASTSAAFVVGAAPTLTIVTSGGGTSGTNYTLSGGVLSSASDVSINASDLVTALGTGNVTLAGNVVISSPITWSSNSVLTLGGTSTNTVAVNSSITGSGNTAGIVIKPSTYSLSTKSGAAISLTGTTPTLSIGGNSYTLIKAIADLSTVTATVGTFWALAKPLTYSTTIDRPAINVAFTGTFDGLGNTVDNMRLTSTANLGAAFIKNLNGGTIRNLGVINSIISLEPTVTTNSLNAGGLVGDSAGGTLDQVWTTGFLRVKPGSTYANLSTGGLVGDVYAGSLTINKSWSSMNMYGWASTFTNVVSGGLVGGTLANWTATGTTLGGGLTITQSYATGDIAYPLATGIHGYGGIVGVHLGSSVVSLTDVFSWSLISINTGAKYGGIYGNATGSTAGLLNAWTVTNQLSPSGSAVTALSNASFNYAIGGSPLFTTNANWYESVNGRQLVNLPMAVKNFYVNVYAPTDGSYGTMSYAVINGVQSVRTLSGYGLAVSGTPTYSIASDALISATPYQVTYVSGLTFTGTGTLYSITPYPFATAVTISKYAQSISLGTTAPTTAAVGSTYTPTATATSALSVVFTIDSASSSVCTIASGVVTFVSIGDCVINANQAGNTSYLAAAQVQQTATATAKGAQTVSFSSTAPSAKVSGSTYIPTGSSTSGLSAAITVDSGSSAICAIASGVVSFTAVGNCVLNINQAGNANWNPAAQIQQTVVVAKGDQTITFSTTAPTSAVVAGTTYTPAATSTSAGVVAFTIDGTSSAVCSIAAGVVSFQTAGTCRVNANQAGNVNWNAATQNFQSFTVGKGDQSITFSTTAPTSAVVAGTTYTPAATSTSAGVVAFTIDGTSSAVCSIAAGVVSFQTAGTCRVNANQAGNVNWNAATQNFQSFTVGKGTTILDFSSVASSPKVNTTYTPVATSAGTGAVTYAIDGTSSSICSISGGVVTFNAVGTCRVNANQATDANWLAPAQRQQIITTVKGDQTITFSSSVPTNAVVAGATYTPAGTSTSGGAVSFTIDLASSTVCSIAAGAVSFQRAGTCKVLANQAGGTNWNAATQNFQTFTVGKGTTSLSFTSTAASPKVNTTYTPVATSAGTGAVTYTIDGTSSSICSISAGVVTFNAVGTCKVNANQASDANWLAPAQEPQTITTIKGDQTITFASVAPLAAVVAGASYTPSATSTSGGVVAFTIDVASAAVCSITNGSVTFQSAGTCKVLANQAGNANWNAAPQNFQTFTVGQGTPTLEFTSNATSPKVNSTYTPVASSSSSGTVTYVIDDASTTVCSISSGVVSFLAVGTCKVNASQIADTNWLSVTRVQQTITVVQGDQTIAFLTNAPTSAVVSGATYTPAATSTSGGTVAFTIDAASSAVCSITSGVISYLAVGTCKVLANQAGNSNWAAATQNFQAFTVSKGSQAITFTSIAPTDAVVDGSAYTVTATGGSTNSAVTFTIDAASTAVCSISGAEVSFTSAGTCAVNANQLGNDNFNAATQVQQTFTVSKGSQTVAFTSAIPTGVRVGDSGYTPTATGGQSTSVLTISSATASTCSITAGVVSFLAAGDCVLEVSQAGDANYLAASNVTQTIAVAKGLQAITQTNSVPAAAFVGMGTFTPTFNGGPSGNAITIEISPGNNNVCTVQNGVITVIGAGLCRYLVNQDGSADYEAANEFVEGFNVEKGTQVIDFTTAAPSAVVGGATYPPAATGGATGHPVVFRINEDSLSVCTISGGAIEFVGVGNCLVEGSQAGDSNYEASANSQSFTVGKGSQAITFTSSKTGAVVAGSQYTPTATGGASGSNVTFRIASAASAVCSLVAGKISFLTPGDCVIEANQVGNTNYLAAPTTTQTVAVGKGAQVLTFNSFAPNNARVGGTTYQPVVTGGASTSSVIFSIANSSSAICSVSNGVVSFTGVGDCVIEANQAGDTNYNPANQLTQIVSVAKGVQVLTFTSTPPSLRPVQGTTYTPTATGSASGVQIVFTIAPEAANLCVINGSGVISFLAVGDCVVLANQAGNSNWNAASQISQVFDITKGEQAITYTSSAPTSAVVGGPAYQPTASGGAGTKAVTFSASLLSADICSVSNGSVTYQAAGECLLVANQASDANYNAATPVIQRITVGKGEQVIAFSSIFLAARVEGTAYRPISSGGLSSSPARFSIATVSSGVCEIIYGTVYFHSVGDCVIEANQDGDANYNAAPTVTQVLTVTKGAQLPLTATASLSSLVLGTNSPTTIVGVTGGSGTGEVTWQIASTSSTVCAIQGDVVYGLAVGYCDLVATKAADDNFEASQASLSISVNTGGQTPVRTSVNIASPVYEPGLTLTLSLTGGNGLGDVWFESLTTDVCTTTESGTVTVLQGGDCTVIGHKNGDASFVDAADRLTFTIARAEQTTLGVSIDHALTYSADGAVTGTLSLTGAKTTAEPTFTMVSGTCTISGAIISATHAGDCVVAAQVAGNESYLDGTVERTITVAKAVPSALTTSVVAGNTAMVAWKGKSVTRYSVGGGTGTGALSATTTTSNICTVSLTGTEVTVTGLSLGTCVVALSQAADANFLARTTNFNVFVLDLPAVPQTFALNNTGATPTGSMSIEVTWSAPVATSTRAVVTGYEVQSKTATTGWETVPGGALAANDTRLTVVVPAWTQVFFRVAPISALDAADGANRNWVTLTQAGTGVPVPFDVSGTLATISTNLAATTSGETVTITGTGFDPEVTKQIQISTSSAVFAAGFGRAALAQTVVVPATVVSPTVLTFVLPKITLPAGRTSLPTQVRILTTNGISSEPVNLDYIPKKLAQNLVVTGLPATKATLNVGGAVASGTATITVPADPTRTGAAPVVTATPAEVCTASVVNRAITITPVGRGTCAVSVIAPATPGFTASAAKTYSYTIKGSAQSVTFANPGPKTFSNTPLTLTALASSLLPVAFSSTSPAVCTVSGSTLTMVAAGTCSVVAAQAGTGAFEPAAAITQKFVIAKANRSAGLTATADSVSATGEHTSHTYDVTSALNGPTVNVFVGENPLDVPVLLNKREGTVLFTVDAAADAAGVCSADPGELGTLSGAITMLDVGTCKVTITTPADTAWNAGPEIIVITVVGAALPDGNVDPSAGNIGDGTLSPEDTDTTVGDADTEPAVAISLDPNVAKTYAFGGEDGFDYDPIAGKINVRTRSVLVGTWTAILKSPSADKKWFKIKGKVVKKVQTYVDVASCTTTLTVKKDPKLKKKVSRIIGAGCLLSDSGKAAFTQVGVQKIKMKYKRIRQYAKTGLDYQGTAKAKKRILKKVNRTIVIKVGRSQ